MSENFNSELSFGFLDLLNETRNAYINTFIWSANRTIEFNKVLLAQLEISQVEFNRFAEDYNNRLRKGSLLFREMIQQYSRGSF